MEKLTIISLLSGFLLFLNYNIMFYDFYETMRLNDNMNNYTNSFWTIWVSVYRNLFHQSPFSSYFTYTSLASQGPSIHYVTNFRFFLPQPPSTSQIVTFIRPSTPRDIKYLNTTSLPTLSHNITHYRPPTNPLNMCRNLWMTPHR